MARGAVDPPQRVLPAETVVPRSWSARYSLAELGIVRAEPRGIEPVRDTVQPSSEAAGESMLVWWLVGLIAVVTIIVGVLALLPGV
jgi:hypothetical protein